MGRKFSIPEDEYEVSVKKTVNNADEMSISLTGKDIIQMPCDKLIMDEENATIYGEETDSSLKELSNDIKKNGFKGVILAYPVGEQYQIESGHRRFLAGKMAGLTEFPVLVTSEPKTDAERRIRLISMNLHSRESLKPTVMVNVINTLLQANKEEQERSGQPSDMASLTDLVAGQVELSSKSIEKYRQFAKIIPELQELADMGISWSALVPCTSLPETNQMILSEAIREEIDRVSVENVSRQWILSRINRMKQDLLGQKEDKVKSVFKRRNGIKIIENSLKEFDDIINGVAVFKDSDKEQAIENLNKIKENIDKAILTLSN